MQGLWVWSLVEELSSHMLLGQKPKTWDRKNIITNSIKTLKMVHNKKRKKKERKKLRRNWGSLIQQPLGIESCQQCSWKASSSPAELWDDWSHKCHLDCSLRELEANDPVKPTQMPPHRKCDIANVVLNFYILGGNLLHSNRWLIQMPHLSWCLPTLLTSSPRTLFLFTILQALQPS